MTVLFTKPVSINQCKLAQKRKVMVNITAAMVLKRTSDMYIK